MGAVLNTAGAAEIAAELACCACSSVCGFLCKDHATRAKLRYCTILLFATIMCFVMLVPGMRRTFDRIPNFCGKLVTNETCDKFFGFGAVYRVMLSMTTFYGMFALFTIRITRVDSFRARFNNGFWVVKFGIILAITVGAFFIPKKSEFFRIWMYACLIGGFVFMLYQVIIVIDFGHSWSVSWAEKLETSNSKFWYLAMVLATLLMFTITLAAIATFYVLFAGAHALNKCKANTFYITFIVIQCFLAMVISVIPTVQQELAGAGLLQSSVVVLYTSYLTFNTLSTEPDAMCNPLGKVILDYDKMSGINGEALFGCLLTFALVIFACTVRAHTSHLGKYGLAISESEEYAMLTLIREESKQSEKKDAEKSEISLDEFVGYNYSLFHVIMALTSLHLLMILTNWHSPEQRLNMRRLVKNWASVWVQMASSFICILLYIWFLVTPLIRKLWAPLFGIVVTEDSGPKGYGSKVISKGKGDGSRVKLEEDKKSSEVKELTFKTNMIKDQYEKDLQNGKDAKLGDKININNENKDENLSAVNSSGDMKRYKSIESLKSAFSSIAKRRNRTNNESDGNSSKNVDYFSDRSRDTVLLEEQERGLEVKGQSKGHMEEGTRRYRSEAEERKQRKGLSRFGSIESLRSGFSAISNVTNKVKRKIRTKLKQNGDGSCKKESEINAGKNRVMSRLEQSFNSRNARHSGRILMNRTFDQSNSHDEMNDSKNKYGSTGKDGGLNSGPVDIENSVETKCKEGRQTPVGSKAVDQGCYAQQQKMDNFEGGNSERPHSSTSNYGSSAFKEKPQDPEVAREILRLQWKILRMQAKVVKIQEKIIRIQAEDETAKHNAQEAVEQLEPPIGQSSVVAGGVYPSRNVAMDEIRRKQQG